MRWLSAVALLACASSCTSSPKATPVPSGRFAVDSFTLPSQHAGADYGGDLNGDGRRDNQIGQALAALDFSDDLTTHGGDMIAAGAIASSLVLDRGAVSYFGFEGADAIAMVAKDDKGVITTGRAKPGMAMVVLPIFSDADPTMAELDSTDVQLVPDGSGGYDVTVHGAIDPQAVWMLVQIGLQQMLYADPDAHYPLADLIDPKRKGSFTPQDLQQNTFLFGLLTPDVNLNGLPMVSLGYGMHVIPCDSGSCVSLPPTDLCHDRVQDGGETGVDCGGTCAACKPLVPSCTDGVRDGLETDVDCGWNCTPCDRGHGCYKATDCFGSFVCISGKCT